MPYNIFLSFIYNSIVFNSILYLLANWWLWLSGLIFWRTGGAHTWKLFPRWHHFFMHHFVQCIKVIQRASMSMLFFCTEILCLPLSARPFIQSCTQVCGFKALCYCVSFKTSPYLGKSILFCIIISAKCSKNNPRYDI